MKKVTGIGGIFFKSPDPAKIKDWYHKHLGLVIDAYGSPFEFRNGKNQVEPLRLITLEPKCFEPSEYISRSK